MTDPRTSATDSIPIERVGDSSIKPVVIAFAVTIVILLVAGVLFIKARQAKAIPAPHDAHPTSQIIYPTAPLRSSAAA